MATLSREQLAELASDAGFTGDNTAIAVAVALAESGGNPKAHNGTPPDDSYGLMQINMLGSMGPARRKQYGLKANTDLYDPATNMRVAHGIYKGSGWKAWTTYTRGTYKKHLEGADASESTPETTSASVSPILGVGDALNALGGTIFNGLANMAGIAVAVVLLILGVVLLGRNLVPVGKVAKVVKKATS